MLAPVWRDYRNRLALLVVAILGLVLWAGGLGDAAGGAAGLEGPLHAAAAAWVTGSVWAFLRFAAFRCPSCGERFHWTLWFANPIAAHCLHCGFAKWRDPDAARTLGRR
jgi:Zn ribbon nucleic-acid-binding protein